jgi:protein-tyrosine phosphatase
VVHRLRCRGVTPILAHAERHADLQDDPGLVAEAVRLGSLVQITALSVTGHLGKRERKLARWLMKRGLAHVLASDAHDPVRRPPGLAEALAVARRLLGDERAGALARENPRRIVTGEVVPTAG